MNYVLLGLIALVLIAGLVAFGVGHRRWSWGTVAAAVLVLLSAAGYLYLASRLAAYEWSWTRFVRAKQVELARQRDALVPDPAAGGRLKPAPNEKPLVQLADEEERWRRALGRIDTWRGNSWEKASFVPPKNDGATGTIEIPVPAAAPAAEGEAAPAEPAAPPPPPLNPGATVFVFDDVPAQDGGRYLGAFLVEKAEFDAAANRHVITVIQTENRDAYDAEVWRQSYDSVTVYGSLPADRWIAFSRTAKPGEDGAVDDAAVMPLPKKLSIEEVEALLQERDRQKGFIAELEKDGEAIDDKEEWSAIRRRLDDGEAFPGEYWATVTFQEPTVVAEGLKDEAGTRGFEAGEKAEFDLQTAFTLADGGKATIEQVRYRRRLRDARTFIHGSRLFRSAGEAGEDDPFKDGIAADGVAALLATLRQEIATLEESTRRLEASRTSISTELANTAERHRRLATDMESWTRDAAAAERMATAFEVELRRSRGLLGAAEEAIVAEAAVLRDSVRRLVERIDATAPAADNPPVATQ